MFLRSRPCRQCIVRRTDDDPDRADVVGGAGGFVHGQDIEVGTAADGSSSRVGQARKGSFGRYKTQLPLRLDHQTTNRGFKFNEAISFQVNCETQEEVDYYWEKLCEGGDEKAQQCGLLKDKYGVSWQVVPSVLIEMIIDPDPEKSQRAMEAMLQMKKIDIHELKPAYAG